MLRYLFCYYVLVNILFFFKQKTAYEMRISDWSSDVCSSDLGNDQLFYLAGYLCRGRAFSQRQVCDSPLRSEKRPSPAPTSRPRRSAKPERKAWKAPSVIATLPSTNW